MRNIAPSKGDPRKVCYVYQDEYPWDVRVEKITSTLAEEGTEVHIVSRNRTNLPAMEYLRENIYVHRLPASRIKSVQEIMNFPAFFSPFWIRKIYHIVRSYSADLVIVRDLPLAPAAYIVSRITKTPVIMDMAENYPALIKSTWSYRGPKWFDYVVRNPTFLKWLERIIIPRMDGIIVVSKHSAERIRSMNGQTNMWIVRNTPLIREEEKTPFNEIVTYVQEIRKSSSFILLYVGFIEAHRGLDIPIKAIPLLKKYKQDIRLVIVGRGTFEKKLKEMAKALNIEKNVIFTGWIPNEQISPFIDIADVCLIPHYVTEHTETTIPNKIFDYMAHKKPVAVTQSRSLTEIVRGANCGFVYQDNSPESLLGVIKRLFDRDTRESLGLNGWQAIQKDYNWHNDRRHLLDAFHEVGRTKRRTVSFEKSIQKEAD